ncbi:DUF3871 family protein [Algibacter sp.]|nr:DUF3871 family protein [Algibacter sp.]
MELQVVKQKTRERVTIEENTHREIKRDNSPFIEANTKEVSLSHLQERCTIPVFAKDNECTLSHQDFIKTMTRSVSTVFPDYQTAPPQIRVSHVIKGRIPEAIRKPAKALLDHEKTLYYERMAFILDIPYLKQTIGVNSLSLTVGGVRAYNSQNLYSKKTIEKFKVFIGFKNQVCTNLCISTDGFLSELRVSSIEELQQRIIELFTSYNAEKHLKQMKTLQDQYLTEKQFAQILGKARLYNYLPKDLKQGLPELSFKDGQLNAIAKDYYDDKSFCRDSNGNISLWNLYNLFTGVSKSSYIDSFLERNVNALNFTNSVSEALKGNRGYHWFLS